MVCGTHHGTVRGTSAERRAIPLVNPEGLGKYVVSGLQDVKRQGSGTLIP